MKKYLFIITLKYIINTSLFQDGLTKPFEKSIDLIFETFRSKKYAGIF
jgi:hypothetical protein